MQLKKEFFEGLESNEKYPKNKRKIAVQVKRKFFAAVFWGKRKTFVL